MHRTRGGHAASKPIDHMRSTQHHVRHSEAHIWIEFRVKQLTLMPATCREHRGYAQHKTGAEELGTIPCALTTREVPGCGTWTCYNTILKSCPVGRMMWNTRPTTTRMVEDPIVRTMPSPSIPDFPTKTVPSRGPIAGSPPHGRPTDFPLSDLLGSVRVRPRCEDELVGNLLEIRGVVACAACCA